MWLFTPFGFFSIVSHRDNADLLCVRGRNREDVAAFAMYVLSTSENAGRLKPVKHTPDADYPYRTIMKRSQVARALANFVNEDLEYDNFKDAVAVHDPARAHLYLEVWSSMRKIDPLSRAKLPYLGAVTED